MAKLLIKNVRLAFPALFQPQAFGDGEPAYSAKFIIDPKSPEAGLVRDALTVAATEKWGAKAEAVLKSLKADKKVCFVEAPYLNKNGDAYDGFEDKFYLSSRNSDLKPSTFSASGQPVSAEDGVIYSGCFVDASVEIYAQDNKWGRRINCSLRGVRFANPGNSFGGGTVASASEFGPVSDFEDFV
ncbi:MAG: ssDNA-binding protein [Alphaproteobacteria bacterium]